MTRDSIFISYSRADRPWLDELKVALGSLGAHTPINAWDDSRIAPSARWREELNEAIGTAAAAVLLLSPGFFASTFIRDFELPPLREAADSGALKLFPVILDHCPHDTITGIYQAVNDPKHPLVALPQEARYVLWHRLGEALTVVSQGIDHETLVATEMVRLDRDLADRPEIMDVGARTAQARIAPAVSELRRENTLCFLEGERCQLTSSALMAEMQKTDITPIRRTAVIRSLQVVAEANKKAETRATELTQVFADETLAMLRARG